MRSGGDLLLSGTVLLSVAAFIGFAQHRHREQPEALAHWRVVHVGGTAGAVQLIALSAVWPRLGDGAWTLGLSAGLIVATWAFFLGPLAQALGRRRAAATINALGAVVALPTYLALPLAFVP
jgi:uncharacterized membrane protein YdcZ (DUF606 family)